MGYISLPLVRHSAPSGIKRRENKRREKRKEKKWQFESREKQEHNGRGINTKMQIEYGDQLSPVLPSSQQQACIHPEIESFFMYAVALLSQQNLKPFVVDDIIVRLSRDSQKFLTLSVPSTSNARYMD